MLWDYNKKLQVFPERAKKRVAEDSAAYSIGDAECVRSRRHYYVH